MATSVTRCRRRALAAGFVGVGLLLGACGLGDKEQQADRIIASVEAVSDAGAATGTLGVADRLVSSPAALGGSAAGGDSPEDAIGEGFGPMEDVERPPLVVEVALDLDRRRSSGAFRGAEHPYAVFDGNALYARRHNAGEREARPWVLVHGDRLSEGTGALDQRDSITAFAAFALDPIVLLDLAAAPLTGSIEEVGTETVAGVETTRYDADFDIDKMLRDTRDQHYPEERRDVIETLFDLFVVSGTTHAGSVWVGDDGALRRFEVTFRQEPFAELRFDLTLTLELTDIGGTVSVTPPTTRQIVNVSSIVQLINTAIPPPGSPEFFELLLGGDRA